MNISGYANRIKMERKNKKISQKKLAELVGIDNTTLSRMENGEREITVENLIRIANALHVNLEYLLLDYVPENTYSDAECLWKQINKLETKQQKKLIDIIMILTQNSSQWSETILLPLTEHVRNEDNKVVDYFEIGQRIRSHRIKNNLTQEKLAELAGISGSFLGSVERGEEILSLETLFKVANALNSPISRFLLNANQHNATLGLCEAVETLAQSGNDKNTLLLNMLTVLVDNADEW